MNTHSHPLDTPWQESAFRLHIADHHGAKSLFVEHASVDVLQKWHEQRHDKERMK